MKIKYSATLLPFFLLVYAIGIMTGIVADRYLTSRASLSVTTPVIDVVNSPPVTVSAIGLVDPVYLDWDKLPDKFIYVTVDKSHFVAAWTSRPSAYGTRWYNDEDGEGVAALPYIHTVGIGHPGDWRKNIWRRPR